MKTFPRPRSESGSTLLIVTATVIVLGIALASVLGLATQEHRILARTAAWNAALPAAEAGIEEAMSHLQQVGGGYRGVNGWTGSGNKFLLARNLTQSQFAAAISSDNEPIITSIGYVWCPSAKANIERAIQVTTKVQGVFSKALVTRNKIKMSGQTLIDSFDSSDPLYSTNGLYTASKRKDGGAIASNLNAAGAIDFSGNNVKIYGNISTQPAGTVVVAGGSVGSQSFIDGGGVGIQTNHYYQDLNVSFPNAVAAITNGSTPVSASVNGVSYKYVLQDGVDYRLSTLKLSGSDKVYVAGKTRLLVDSDISLAGGTYLEIATNGSVEVYLKAGTVSMAGQAVMNLNGKAANFSLFGLTNVTAIDIGGSGAFLGTIYAPQAKLSISGGGGSVLEYTGAAIVDSFDANGHYNFHFDEALLKVPTRKLIITAWKEL